MIALPAVNSDSRWLCVPVYDKGLTSAEPGLSDYPEAPVEALQITAQLRACAPAGSRVFLFCPASPRQSVSGLVRATALALVQMNERPVLIVALDAADPRGPDLFSGFPSLDLGRLIQDLAGWQMTRPGGDATPVTVARSDQSLGLSVNLLTSERFDEFLAEARRRAAYVLFDGRSVLESIESILVARRCDGVVLSVTSARTSIAEVTQAKKQLANVHARIVGFVFERDSEE